MVDIESITTGLKQGSSGIWFSDERKMYLIPQTQTAMRFITILKTDLFGSSTGTIAFCQL